MRLLVMREDGTIYDLEEYGIQTIDFYAVSTEVEVTQEKVDARNGWVDMGATLKGRALKGEFKVKTPYIFTSIRNDIYKIFRSIDPFYVIDLREGGKRWKVRAAPFEVKQIMENRGEFEIDFFSDTPFAESIGTTLTPFTFDAEVWQLAQGLIANDDMVYTHTSSYFQIYNAGEGIVDPVEDYLVITFQGTSTNLQIINETTGDVFEYYGTTGQTDKIILDGVQVLKNTVNVLDDSNMDLLTLAIGPNQFKIMGAGSFNISFDFRFKYE